MYIYISMTFPFNFDNDFRCWWHEDFGWYAVSFFFMMRTVAAVRERHFYDAVNGYKML